MKIRNGFVSNSSSSSFLITGKAYERYIEIGGEYAFPLSQSQVNLIDKIPLELKSKDWYITDFISDCYDDGVYPSSDVKDAIEYQSGGHGSPYSEQWYDKLSDRIWLLKEHNINKIEQQTEVMENFRT